MPELPEVETVMRGLRARMEGRVIERAEVRRPALRWPLPEGLEDGLSDGSDSILRPRCRPKLLYRVFTILQP